MNRLLFIFFCLVFNQTLAQPFSKEGFQTFNYSTENGLPSNGVKGMHWDEDGGFLWIATEAGISRFNGIDFVNYTRNNTSFIESERMRFSITNANGEMRVVDLDGNIIGIKEASGSVEQIMNVINVTPKEFMVISGDDALTLPLLSAGCDGVISVVGNAFPKEFSQMI